MWRVLAVAAACLWLCVRTATADTVASNVRLLDGGTRYKVRLAAALSLSKSRDARAVIALAGALRHDDDASIRRVAALALQKMIDTRTPDDARELGLGALETAAQADLDPKVRATAKRALKSLAGLRRRSGAAAAPSVAAAAPPKGPRDPSKPAVFVNIDPTMDQSKQLTGDTSARITRIVKRNIESTGYATSWPGGLPTEAELASSQSRAFIVASTVKKVEITKIGGQTQIACTVALRVAPWSGRDGGERWEANKAASASGSAKATTGNREREIQNGVHDCLEAVTDDVAGRQVVPFLRRLAQAP